MSITSQENIELLRNLLKDHPLQLADPRHFHDIFKKELERIHTNRFNFKSNLMLMNKEILKTFQIIKGKMIQESNRQQSAPSQTEQQSIQQREIHPNKNENINMKIFEKSLKEKQSDFNNLMNKEKPKEIDFTDKKADSIMSQSDFDHNMSQREAELAKIMQGQQQNKNVEAWLKGETNSKPSNVNLKIDHSSNVKLDAIQLQRQKRVRFKETTSEKGNEAPQGVDFFSKLKLKKNDTTQDSDYKSMFKDMINNQKLILEQLKNISEQLKPKDSGKAIRL